MSTIEFFDDRSACRAVRQAQLKIGGPADDTVIRLSRSRVGVLREQVAEVRRQAGQRVEYAGDAASVQPGLLPQLISAIRFDHVTAG